MNYQNIFNRDFYTTPREVIEMMTMGESLQDAVILEPSAGSGNIVRYCQEMGARYVMACEFNDTLRQSLYNICNVIAPDFLSLTPDRVSSVNYIIMNPPFTNVERHINHAFDIAPAGCTIIALCPSSRFVYPDSSAKLLKERIELYGIREDLGDVFNNSNADRRTDAAISLIKLYKPGEGASEFDGFMFDQTPEGYEDQGNGKEGLITYNAVRDMVARYVDAMKRYDEVQRQSEAINESIKAFSSCSIRFGAHGKDHDGNQMSNITRDRFRKELQHAAWAKVFGLLNMQKYSTNALKAKIAKFVEQSEAMPFTMKNIYLVVNMVLQNIGNIMNECVVKAFDTICELSAENTTAGEKWKTNSNYMVNQRFIVDCMGVEGATNTEYKDGKRIENYYLRQSWSAWSGRRDQINDLYKALCFVAGKQINEKVWNPFETDVINKCDDFGTWFDFDWFRVRFYKKGTMHFEFTDINVWYRFNQIAATAKGWKLGSQTQCKAKAWKERKGEK